MNPSVPALLLALSLAPVLAHAGERRDVLSRVWALDRSRVVEADTGHRFLAIISEEAVLADVLPSGHPFKQLEGTCVGWLESRLGFRKGSGDCVFTNPAGGRWQLSWNMDADDGGSYTVRGVGGDASGWTGAGRWRTEAEFSADRFTQTWQEWIESP